MKLLAAIEPALLILTLPSVVPAEVRPNSLFADNAVFQRGKELPIWGTAREGERVTVEFAGQSVSTIASDGKWKVLLKPMNANAAPQRMTIAGDNTIILNNILIGDVWVASGQSNMERQLGPRPPQKPIENWEAEVAAADCPQIREYYVPEHLAYVPATDASGQWNRCSPQTVSEFSAVGYLFARDIQQAERVPIGILFTAWGGTVAEAWTSAESLKSMADFKSALELLHRTANDPPAKSDEDPNTVAVLYNAMIAPLQAFPIKGVIWYQGESNNDRAEQYRQLFPLLISDWRQGWNCGAFPFLFVQIAPYREMKPELREAQFLTLSRSPNTAMAVITDAGDADDVHPARKQVPAKRLALAARALGYDEKLEYSGPLFASMKTKGNKVVISFTHVGTGLVATNGEPKGFTIAGADKNFVAAKAMIKRKKVVVWSEQVSRPLAVRYGWANVPDVNLFNKEDLPASPFRTDVVPDLPH